MFNEMAPPVVHQFLQNTKEGKKKNQKAHLIHNNAFTALCTLIGNNENIHGNHKQHAAWATGFSQGQVLECIHTQKS